MPESKKRNKRVYTPPPAPGATRKKGPSPVWLAPLMLTFFVLGVAWLVVFYVAGTDVPYMRDFSNYNLLIGFGFIIVGFGLSTQWR